MANTLIQIACGNIGCMLCAPTLISPEKPMLLLVKATFSNQATLVVQGMNWHLGSQILSAEVTSPNTCKQAGRITGVTLLIEQFCTNFCFDVLFAFRPLETPLRLNNYLGRLLLHYRRDHNMTDP